MIDVRIKLSVFWVALMLVYLLGDVMRIFSGAFTAGEVAGMQVSQWMWLGMAAIMLIPIFMVILSVILPYRVNRWANIIVSAFFIVFNLFGLPYPSAFDNFLIVVSFVINALTIWYAWKWV